MPQLESQGSPPLAHTRRSRVHSLAASATTIHHEGDGSGSRRIPDCSVIASNPSTEQSGQIAWVPHGRMKETTGGTTFAGGMRSERVLNTLVVNEFFDNYALVIQSVPQQAIG